MRYALLLSFLLATNALADEDEHFYPERPLDFSLSFSQQTLALDYGASTVDTTVNRVDAAWREPFTDRLQLGLLFGYAFLTQTNNPATAGRELHGYDAGFLLDLDLLRLPRADVSLSASWIYQKFDDHDAGQTVVISWSEPSVRLGVNGRVTEALRAYGGVRYGAIDGQQRLSGAVNETRQIQQTDRTGAFAGLELAVEGTGYIGAAAQSGPDRSVALYFGRRF